MTSAAALTVNLPGSPYNDLPLYSSVAAIRALPFASIRSGQYAALHADGLESGAVYTFDPASLASDDGEAFLRPNDLTPLQAGRWLSTLGLVIPKGDKGDPGASTQVADTLASPAPDVAASTGVVARVNLAKPDRYPTNPASVAQANYETHFALVRARFYDDTNSRLYPTRGLGPTNGGCPDTSLPDASGNKLSVWQWCCGIFILFDRWKITGTATAKNRIAGAWTYFQTQYTVQQMTSTTYGQNPTTGISDDNSFFVSALRMIHEATGDATALSILVEYLAGTYIMYADPRTSNNPVQSYNATTPGGLAIQRSTYGIQYEHRGYLGEGYGDFANNTEIWIGQAAFYVSQQATTSTLTAAVKAAYLQLAKDTWTWAVTWLRFAGSAQAVAGIYGSSFILNPNASDYHKINAITTNPTTRRGKTAFADHGTLFQAALSDSLYTLTGEAKYLAEFQSILTVYPTQTTGFGRTWKGLPCFVCAQDPWTVGIPMRDVVSRLVARFPIPADPAQTLFKDFRLGVLGTAKTIAAQSGNGLISPNWGPPEESGNAGCMTWEQDSMAGYSGQGGGGQASGRQIMTASSGLSVVAAGAVLVASEAVLGSGMSAASVEILASTMATALISQEAAKLLPMREEHSTASPFQYRVSTDRVYGWRQEFINEKELRRLAPGGQTQWGKLEQHGAMQLDDTLYGGAGLVAYGPTFGNQFYMGNPSGSPRLNFASGSYLEAQQGLTRISTVVGSNEQLRVEAGTLTTYGYTYFNQDIQPLNDNVISVGGTSRRFKNIYATNSTINTSDERDKNWIVSGLTDKEYRAALRILKEVGSFTWKANSDRVHYGVRAQAVWRICSEEGLIPSGSSTDSPLSFLVYDEWDAQPAEPAVQAVDEISHFETRILPDGMEQQVRVVDVEGVMGTPGRAAIAAGNRYGVRDEIDKLMLAALARLNATQIEAALNAQ
jgi:hypothetical protein